MDANEFINYVIANKEIIIIILLAGGALSRITRGARKILSAVATVMMLVAALSFFGVPIEPLEEGFRQGVSKFEEMFGQAKDIVPGYVDKASDILQGLKEVDLSGEPITVHYLDVGQADCALIVRGEDTMLIDTGNRDDDGIVSAYLDGLGIEQLAPQGGALFYLH